MELPWAEIKTEYLTTGSGYETLAKKYGCSKALIARRGKKEGWHAGKLERQAAVNQAVAEATRFDTEAAVDRLRTVREAAEAAAGIAWDELTTRRNSMTSKEYRDYVAGLKDLTAMLREFYCIPTYSQQEQLQLAREKLELERQRSQPEQMDNEIRVVMDDDLADYFE
jgi:hypothetical protein